MTITFGESLQVGYPSLPDAETFWLHQDSSRQIQSALPVISTNHAPPRMIGVAGKNYAMKHGLIDLTLDLPDGPLRVGVLRLKDREYHRGNPAELRRSEARKWRSLLKAPASSGIDFILLVEAFAGEDSAPMKALVDALPVSILPAADASGGTWTHQDAKDGSQHRWRFALANPGATERVRAARLDDKTRAIQLEFAP